MDEPLIYAINMGTFIAALLQVYSYHLISRKYIYKYIHSYTYIRHIHMYIYMYICIYTYIYNIYCKILHTYYVNVVYM